MSNHSYRVALELIARGYEGPVGNCEGLSGTRCAEIAKAALDGPNDELLLIPEGILDAITDEFHRAEINGYNITVRGDAAWRQLSEMLTDYYIAKRHRATKSEGETR